jgi:hypothetical protein
VRAVLAVVPAVGASAAEQMQDNQRYDDDDNDTDDTDDAHFVSLGDGLLLPDFPGFPEVRGNFRPGANEPGRPGRAAEVR